MPGRDARPVTAATRTASGRDIELCVDLWAQVIAARDGSHVLTEVAEKTRAAFARPLIRFAEVGSPPQAFALTIARDHRAAHNPSVASHGLAKALLPEWTNGSGRPLVALIGAVHDWDRRVPLPSSTGRPSLLSSTRSTLIRIPAGPCPSQPRRRGVCATLVPAPRISALAPPRAADESSANLVSILVGVRKAAIMTACTTLIVDYFHEERRRNRYLGLQTVVTTLGTTVFILLGGALHSRRNGVI